VQGNCVANDGIFEDGVVSLRKHRPISDFGPIPIKAIAQALLPDDQKELALSQTKRAT
jgi:hypothetical protein